MNTVAEIAKRLRVSTRHVYCLVEQGTLPAYKIGSAIRISEEQLQSYLENSRHAPHGDAQPTKLRRLKV